ncbi:MAG TPA: FYDLN acid domain-containing protein [Alphaproteobacteria bacterium]|nr:FYDLN acid domain-containing protein [Alphaproteobacteria bacterium]
MANPRWGRKRACTACGAAFYDMLRNPITCPKCGIRHQPIVLLKSGGRASRTNFIRSASTSAPIASLEPPPASRVSEVRELDKAAGHDNNFNVALADEPVGDG